MKNEKYHALFNQLEQIAEWMKDSAQAFSVAHKENIFHLNFTPQMVCFKSDKIKIAGFGEKVDIEKQMLELKCGSGILKNAKKWIYFPPEIISGKIPSALGKAKLDVYTWAMVFYQMLSRKSSEILLNEWKAYKQGGEAKYVDFIKILKDIEFPGFSTLTNLLIHCLQYNPESRPLFPEIISEYISQLVPLKSEIQFHSRYPRLLIRNKYVYLIDIINN